MGMASAIRGAPIMPAGARVTLDADGIVTVESNMTDMGTGSYTVIGQTAAEMMGVSLDRRGQAGRLPFPRSLRRRRTGRRGDGHRRRLCRMRETAGRSGRPPRLQQRGRHLLGRQGSVGRT
jgi:CO/xanthine dehydrogenase Mo-binding subunit